MLPCILVPGRLGTSGTGLSDIADIAVPGLLVRLLPKLILLALRLRELILLGLLLPCLLPCLLVAATTAPATPLALFTALLALLAKKDFQSPLPLDPISERIIRPPEAVSGLPATLRMLSIYAFSD